MKIDIRERDNAFTLSDKVRELMAKDDKKMNKDEPIFTSDYVDNLRMEWAIKLLKYVYLLLAFVFMYVLGESYLNVDNGLIRVDTIVGTIIFAYISYKIIRM